MFLEGTLHILLVYLGIGLVLCVPPRMKRWKKLVGFLNRAKINGRRLSRVCLLLFPPLMTVSVIICHLYCFHRELNISFWYLFMPAGFIAIQFMSSFFGVASFASHRKRVKFGNLVVLTLFFVGFGLAATNIHDALWCGRRTNFYTQFSAGGEDIAPWVNFFHAPSYDYRIFGFYMLIQAIVLLAMAHANFFGFMRINKVKRKLTPLKLNWVAIVFLSFTTALIDWPDVISPPFVTPL